MNARSKRANGEGSVFFDATRACWIATITYTVGGVRYRPVRRAKTKSEARFKLRQLIALRENGSPLRDRSTVIGYIESWLASSQSQKSTIARYRTLLKRVAADLSFARTKLDELDGDAIMAFYAATARRGTTASDLRKLHLMLHSVFEDARHLKRIARNPCDLPKKAKPRYATPEMRPLDRDQEAALIAAARGDRYEALIVLALDAGLRQGEAFALEIDDVRFEADEIVVTKSLKDDENGQTFVGTTKTRTSRTIDLAPSTIFTLREHIRKLRAAGYDGPLLFPDRKGGYLRRRNFNRREFAKILARAGLEGFTFHDLRHTMATLLLSDAAPIAAVSKRLGHSKVSTTLDYYAHVLPESRGTLASRFEARRAAVATGVAHAADSAASE